MNGKTPLERILNRTGSGFIWTKPIFGAEEDGDGDGDGDGQGGNGEGGQGSGGNGDGDGDDEGTDFSGIDDPKDRRIAELSDEAAKRRRKLRETKSQYDTQIADLNKQIKELQKAQKSGQENQGISDEEREEIEAPHLERMQKMEATMRRQAIESAILAESQAEGAKRRVWHSTQNVYSQIDLDAIDFDPESGTIEGVTEELDRIAREQSFLVKEKGKAKSTKEKDENGGGRQGPSGRQPGGAGRTVAHGMDQQRETKLKEKYSFLGRR